MADWVSDAKPPQLPCKHGRLPVCIDCVAEAADPRRADSAVAARAAGWVPREEHECVLSEAAAMRGVVDVALRWRLDVLGQEEQAALIDELEIFDGIADADGVTGAASRLLAELRARRVLDEEHATDCQLMPGPLLPGLKPFQMPRCTCGLAEREEEAWRVLKEMEGK